MTPLFTIIVSLLGCFCFYQWDQNRKDAEEVQELMERTKRLEEEKKQRVEINRNVEEGKTRQLVLFALDKLGCRYEDDDEDHVRVTYQGETFIIECHDDCLFINVIDPWWYVIPTDDDIEEFAHMQKAINQVNSLCGSTLLYTINKEEKKIGVHTMKNLIFIPQIPDIHSYLESIFVNFFRAKRDVLAEIEKYKAVEAETARRA